jgi:hypothetical protein
MSTPLSPAAAAVLNAANSASAYNPDDCLNESRWIAAAALETAADQVVPEHPTRPAWTHVEQVRRELLAIAAELKGQ